MKTKVAIFVAALVSSASTAIADDTATLPQGIARVRLRTIGSLTLDRWNQDGRAERITRDLDGRDLDSEVFPDLAILERIYGARAESLSLGISHVEGRVELAAFALGVEYGVTERFSAGIGVPLVWARHALSRLELDPVTTCDAQRCGMARNPGDTKITREDTKYLPLDHDKDGRTRNAAPLSKEDVQTILVEDLGYRRLEDWSAFGVGDIELGAKYRIIELGPYATAVQGGLRLPTGRTDDPHDLLDIGFGDGQTDLGFYWQNDLQLRDDVLLNATLRWIVQLPDRELKRVPPSADVPLAKKEDIEEVWRDLGDIYQAEVMFAWSVLPVLEPFARYAFTAKGADDVRGDRGLAYRSLIEETAQRNHTLEVGVVFSTVPWVVEQQYWLPLDVSLSFERSLAGSNNAPIANVLSLEVAAYFEVLR